MMEFTIHVGGKAWQVTGPPVDLSIPLVFDGPQPNSYGVPPARKEVYRDGTFTGDVRAGGSCNFETYTLTPHCNGTHTEAVGHLTAERIAVTDILHESLLAAVVISVAPVAPGRTVDQYPPGFQPEDRVIDAERLERALSRLGSTFTEAVIIRTLPNPPEKRYRDYMQGEAVPFLTPAAMRLLRQTGFRHLLVDLPSVDRLLDEGMLASHRTWWEVPAGSHTLPANDRSTRTITEFIYVPDSVPDGDYVLDLQVAPFVADAAPSRPMLYQVRPLFI